MDCLGMIGRARFGTGCGSGVAMSMQGQRGGRDGLKAVSQEHDRGAWPGAQARSPTLVASLAGGLQSLYEARPDTDIPDAFADLLIRIEAAERARA